MKIYLLILLCIACVAQWYVPSQMIAEQESIIRDGKAFKFETQPVDPSDPFRGKYITLYYKINEFIVSDTSWSSGDQVFVILGESENGYVTIKGISDTKPDAGDFVKAKVSYVSWGNNWNNKDEAHYINLEYSFERFYVEESKASGMERTYRENNRNNDSLKTYAIVKILNGDATLKDVMINDRSILDIIKEINNKAAITN